ncbi:hypothetical protein [Nocardioides marmoribigeumensis]|uniref:Phosphatase PAP2 family protein n=1 Tax=Nocardioides marmoribigeumensis TaxID=433649 RepID=A0ABU2BYH2_9ACTN|nr:hypothetical protein [Nocardioides marmoribigeumensis]MDR7363458.1 hypothetical protein [Nocardioides marmoribigeumensis]
MRRRGTGALVALATVAALAGTAGPAAYAQWGDTSAKDRVEADPPPALFADGDLAPAQQALAGTATRAHAAMRQWWAQHGTKADDAAFMTWAAAQVPAPPAAAARTRELTRVQQLSSHRSTAGETAATWLEVHGKKDVWKLAAHDAAEVLPSDRGQALKDAVDLGLTMTKTLADGLAAEDRQPAPYVVHPELRPDHHVSPGQTCPCSYPSRHAARGAASRTVLSLVEPHRAADYRWTEDEVDYSRLYMAGHVPSDLTGGAFLGDLVGEYVARTRLGISAATG